MEAAAASGETLDAASPSNLAVVVRSVAGRSRRAAPPAVSDTAVLDSSLLLGSRGPVVVFFRNSYQICDLSCYIFGCH
ncbi:hypothetical protein PAHAL_1G417400 [Panicum hallii]|uniref:Uncharacterized protein n=1 Tax=Panicum hallii TaxID=206008 RepID=A0A2T8KY03_9POAL|nr:hypothetical protein PAHAL_1G417400 [Panicum hallii]